MFLSLFITEDGLLLLAVYSTTAMNSHMFLSFEPRREASGWEKLNYACTEVYLFSLTTILEERFKRENRTGSLVKLFRKVLIKAAFNDENQDRLWCNVFQVSMTAIYASMT